jgi:aconitase B
MTWNWTDLEQIAFVKAKELVAQAHALTVIRNGEQSELDVTVEQQDTVGVSGKDKMVCKCLLVFGINCGKELNSLHFN